MARPFPVIQKTPLEEVKIQTKQTTKSIRRLLLTLLLTLLASFLACDTEVKIKLSMTKACPVPQALSTAFQKNTEAIFHGCLVMFWQSQKKSLSYQQPLNIDKNGTITMLDKEGDQNGSLQLPVSSLQHPLLLRIYLFPPDKNNQVQQDSAEHELLCRKMSAYQYDCFQHKNECWMTFLLKPEVKSGNKTLKAYLPSVAENETCRVCIPEKCDGKDNDCDGKVDEQNAAKSIPCSPRP